MPAHCVRKQVDFCAFGPARGDRLLGVSTEAMPVDARLRLNTLPPVENWRFS